MSTGQDIKHGIFPTFFVLLILKKVNDAPINFKLSDRNASGRICIQHAPRRFEDGLFLGQFTKFMDMGRTIYCKELSSCECSVLKTFEHIW